MKKKSKETKTRQDMPEFSIKQFTPEEDKVYEDAVNAYRDALAAGKNLKEAYGAYTIADEELRSIVQADFLKILIAERHFGKREQLEAIGKELDVPLDVMKQTLARMLQEVGVTAANQFVAETGGIAPKTDD
jgi:hypothetical protein